MGKRRIIINIESEDVTDMEAVMLVNSVIAQGRISKAGGRDIYCFQTAFHDNKIVAVHPYCKGDVFTVWRSKRLEYLAPRQHMKPVLLREEDSPDFHQSRENAGNGPN